MKTILFLLILLPAVAHSTACQVNGQYVYCPQSTMQNLNNGFYAGPRPHETIESDPVRQVPIDPYSEGYYRPQVRQVRPFPSDLDPFEY